MEVVGDYRKYLDPKVLAKIGGLELRARMAVQGYFTGMHRSPYRGVSSEFVDHRSYSQGDDLRHIDWRVFGRTDKYYIKQFEQDINLNCVMVVDSSESMQYRSSDAPMSKRDYAACIAASLSYLAIRQRDAVGLVTFDETIQRFIKPSGQPGQWKIIVGALDEPCGRKKTSLRRVLEDLADRLQRRTLVILVSDLFDDVEDTLIGLKCLTHHKHETIVCNVWDPVELRFEFKGPTMFDGLEASGRLLTEPQSLRSRYLAEVNGFIDGLRRGCREMLIDYRAYDSATPLDTAISTYLATRASRIRLRSSRVLGGR